MIVRQPDGSDLRCKVYEKMVRQAVSTDRSAYVLVNNRSEGNAPLTMQGLPEILRG